MVRKSARFLAPIAIAAVALGVYLIVHANVATTHSSPTHTSRQVVRRSHRSHRPAPAKPRFYSVRPGDSLSAIAGRTGVSLSQLTSLNPSLSPPYSLQSGQRLRLRR